MTCTAWCTAQYFKAVEEGREEDAQAYMQLAEMWKAREQ